MRYPLQLLIGLLLITFSFNIYAQADFQLSGNGGQAVLGNDCYRLTQAQNNQFGSMWFRRKADLNQEFDLSATLNFGNTDGNGADGIVFAFQNLCSNAGGGGGGIGIQGVSPSIFVEFDTYRNPEFNDPTNDHIAILRDGQVNHNSGASLVAPVCALSNCGNIENGTNFLVRIHWQPALQKLDVYFNNELRTSYTGNVIANIFGGNPYVYWGFTSATGGFNNQHTVCIESFNNNIIQLEDASICAGGSYQANLPGGTNYQWTPSTFISNTNISNPVLNPPTTTTYVVSITDACNNVQTDSITVTVNPLPNVALNLGASSSVCSGTAAFNLSGGTPSGGSYSGTGVTSGVFNPTTAGVGTFPITYTFTNSNGCTNSATTNLTVNANPTVTFNAIAPLCANAQPVSLSGSPAGGTFSGTGVSGNTFNPTGLSGNVNLSYTVTNPQGCTGSASQTAVVNPTPDAQIQTPQGTVLCGGGSVTLNVANQAGIQYEWSRNNVVISALAAGNNSFSATQAGSYTVRAVASNGCQRISSAVVITTGTNPTASISAAQTAICPGASTAINLSATGAAQVVWQLNGSTIAGQSANTLTATAAGAYTAQVSSSDGCTVSSNSLNISQLPGAPANITAASSAFCPNTDQIALQCTNTPGATYTWFFNGAQQSATGAGFSATAAGNYFVITTLGTCSDTSNTLTLTNGAVPSVSISASSTSICEGSSTTINATGSNLGSFNWQLNGSTTGGNTATLNASTAGTYSVIVTSADGCQAGSNSLSLTVIPAPTASLSSSGTFFCPGGNPVVLTANTLSGATYQFLLNGNAVGQAGSSNTFTVQQGGNYSVTVSDGTCSSTSSSINISQGSLPGNAGNIFGSNDFCPGEQLDFSIFNVTGATSYLWSVSPANAGTIHFGQGTNEILFDALNQSFTLTVTPQNQCGSGQSTTESVTVDNGQFCNFFEVVIGAFPTLTCTGNTVTFYNYSDAQSFFGGTPQWNFGSGATPATATGNGPFNVTYSSAGLKNVSLAYVDNFGFELGSALYTEFINVSSGVQVPVIAGNAQLAGCSGVTETYSVGTGTPGHTYTWTAPGNASISSGQGSPTVQITFNGTAGNITVVETDLAGCSSTAAQFSVECPTSIDGLENWPLILFPNPAGNFIQLQGTLPSGSVLMSIVDIRGAVVSREMQQWNGTLNEAHPISISHLSKGLYFLQIQHEKGLENLRFIKQ